MFSEIFFQFLIIFKNSTDLIIICYKGESLLLAYIFRHKFCHHQCYNTVLKCCAEFWKTTKKICSRKKCDTVDITCIFKFLQSGHLNTYVQGPTLYYNILRALWLTCSFNFGQNSLISTATIRNIYWWIKTPTQSSYSGTSANIKRYC